MSETCSTARCDNCAHFNKGYRMGGFNLPSFCNWHSHVIEGDDLACQEHQPKEGGHG